jgi:CubicO group peptidase (beta-lactamase class C family)
MALRLGALGALIGLLAAASSAAQTQVRGLSRERLERVRAALAATVERGELAGGVVLVARRGEVAYFEAVGLADQASRRPMRRDSIFRIASMTKPVTSVAALMLLEEGRFQLSDPVARYIPQLGGLKVLRDPTGPLDAVEDLAREMTIRDLLTHTSGLTASFMGEAPIHQAYEKQGITGSRTPHDPATFIARLATLPLAHQPGTRFAYGTSTDVLGHLVAVVSGQPFEAFLAERIFEPLGMGDTGFVVPAAKLERLTTRYAPAEGGGLQVTDPGGPDSLWARPRRFASGAGGLVSTAPDYLRFAQMLANGGELDGVRLLGRKTVELMTLPHLTAQEREVTFLARVFPGVSFGLGVSVLEDVARRGLPGSVGSFGWGGAAGTHFWVDPHEQLIGILMVQLQPQVLLRATPAPFNARHFELLTYQALVDPRPVQEPSR